MNRAPIMKDGDFHSLGLRAWVKRQRCAFCNRDAPSEPHHYPSRGAGGDDMSIICLCREHHDQAQQYRAPLTAEWQHIQALVTLRLFVRTATEEEWTQFAVERERWMRSRIWVPM